MVKKKKKAGTKHPVASFLLEAEKQQWRPHPVYGFLEPRYKKEKYIQDRKIPKTKKNKDMDYKQAREAHGLPPFGNYDGDRYDNGVPVLNAMDCHPLDPLRHGVGSWIRGAVRKAPKVADRLASRAIRGARQVRDSRTARALREAHRERVRYYSRNMEEFQKQMPRQQVPLAVNIPDYRTPLHIRPQRPEPQVTINIDHKLETIDDLPHPIRAQERPPNNPPVVFAENRQTGAIVYPIRGPLNPALYKIQRVPKKDFEKILKDKGIRL